MRFQPFFSIAAAGLLLASCTSPPAPGLRSAKVTVNRLLAEPDHFDGAPVIVTGCLTITTVGRAGVFLADNYRGRCIRLDLDPAKENPTPFEMKKCVVQGTFHGLRLGPAPFIGGITSLELAK
jgi:hypothetical protein